MRTVLISATIAGRCSRGPSTPTAASPRPASAAAARAPRSSRLLDRQACALSAYEIEDALRADGRGVARASVYRVLEELVGLGLVTRVEVGQGTARYEAARPDGHHHHHMVCDRCGDVQPFADDELERAVDRLAARVAFDVAEHEIVLHGECADCRR